MNTKSFSQKEAIRFGWEVAKGNIWFFIGVYLFTFFVTGLLQGIATIPMGSMEACNTPSIAALIFTVLVFLIDGLLQVIFKIGIIKIYLKFIDNEQPLFNDLISHYRLLGKYILGSIILGLIVMGGFILLIIPGIIFAIKYGFCLYLIVDKELRPMEALKESAKMTDGVKWDLVGFYLLLGLINILGALALIIGLFVTVPLTMAATAYVYRQLLAQSEGGVLEVNEENAQSPA